MSELVPARPHIKHTHCVGMNRECKLARNSCDNEWGSWTGTWILKVCSERWNTQDSILLRWHWSFLITVDTLHAYSLFMTCRRYKAGAVQWLCVRLWIRMWPVWILVGEPADWIFLWFVSNSVPRQYLQIGYGCFIYPSWFYLNHSIDWMIAWSIGILN